MSEQGEGQKEDGALKIFWIFLRLGVTAFGGPIAHLGHFREEFVHRRRWISDQSFLDLVALCQCLPGPGSSQVGIALGFARRGMLGSLAAWTGFTLPSALALIAFASVITRHSAEMPDGVLHGLKIVAVAVVAQAVWGMARASCAGLPQAAIMAGAAGAALILPTTLGQMSTIVVAGVTGVRMFAPESFAKREPLPIRASRRTGMVFLALFLGLLLGLPGLNALLTNQTLAIISAFFQTGALVFGGGHVVLPLLQSAVVPSGWVSNDIFLAGYGAAQAIPGPLFSFAAYLGASMASEPTGWIGGVLCLLAIFTPSFLLVWGTLPFWEQLRTHRSAQAALTGVNAAVVGLLLAALYDPVWTSAIHRPQDAAVGFVAFIALGFWKVPPWVVVGGCGTAGWLVSLATRW